MKLREKLCVFKSQDLSSCCLILIAGSRADEDIKNSQKPLGISKDGGPKAVLYPMVSMATEQMLLKFTHFSIIK